MGHYAAEMMCTTCGKCRCICPPKPDPDRFKWILDDLTPIQICDFDKKYATIKTKYGSIPGMPMLKRMSLSQYSTRAAAEAAIPGVIQDRIFRLNRSIEECQEKVKAYKAQLKELKRGAKKRST